jgi:hypothetical protein
MSCFSSATNNTSTAAADPAKHVNYSLGMVLGVDDFTQEFAYLSGRDQWMMRDLIGYGTVRGLSVTSDVDPEKGPRVMVEPGVALSPGGQMICVPTAQCAYVKSWVADHQAETAEALGSPLDSSVTMYVVLCYRDCEVDNVPIAGEPCRSEDQLMAPSRVKDDFCLQLRLQKPGQREEDAIRDFVAWLRQIPVRQFGLSTPSNQFLNAIRNAASTWFTSPPAGPLTSPPIDFMTGSPPFALHIQSMDLCKYMAAAFRLWVTELRPKWISRWHGCAATHLPSDNAGDEDCVLLAQVEVPVTVNSPGGVEVADGPVIVSDGARPYVLHLRMLQDWVTCGVRQHVPTEMRVRSVSGAATVHLFAGDELLLCDTQGGAIEVDLPAAADDPGRVVTIKRISAGSQVRIVPLGSDEIDGKKSVPLTAQFKSVQLVSGGILGAKGLWHIVASN